MFSFGIIHNNLYAAKIGTTKFDTNYQDILKNKQFQRSN